MAVTRGFLSCVQRFADFQVGITGKNFYRLRISVHLVRGRVSVTMYFLLGVRLLQTNPPEKRRIYAILAL
jgi:hypothetical protein